MPNLSSQAMHCPAHVPCVTCELIVRQDEKDKEKIEFTNLLEGIVGRIQDVQKDLNPAQVLALDEAIDIIRGTSLK